MNRQQKAKRRMNNQPDSTIPIVPEPLEPLDVIKPGRGMCHLEAVSPGETAGGIIIPESAQQSTMSRWRVLGLGEPLLTMGGQPVPFTASVGDEVLLSSQSGAVAPLEGQGAVQVLASDQAVLAVVKVRGQ